MRRFSDDFIERVLAANNIVDLITPVTVLKQSGGRYMGRCPFHNEKTASFSVNEPKQVYHCFGCKKSGNVISFLRDYHGMSFPEAIEYLAERGNIPLPKTESISREEQQRSDLRKQVLRANQLALEYFEQRLRSESPDSTVAAYVARRGLKDETILQFNLGLSGAAWDGLTQFLQSRGVTPEAADAAGLIRRRKEGTGYFDLFRERLMFPILNPKGEVLGFGGRILEKGEPKYLNSPETPVFHKGRTLYGLNLSGRFIRSEDQVLVVEGYMDLIALFQDGFHNVVATLGTALTPDHAVMLSKMTKNVVVLFDGDDAGQAAAEKSLPILLKAGLRPRGLTLPEGMDPDEFLKSPDHGPEALKKLIEGCPDLFNLVVGRWTRHFKGNPSDKLRLLEMCQPVIKEIPDQRLYRLYVQELSQSLQMSPSEVAKSLTGEAQALKRGAAPGAMSGSREVAGVLQSAGQKLQSVLENPLSAATEEPEQLFSVKKAPRAERVLLSLVTRKRIYLEQALKMQIGQHLTAGGGAREILNWVAHAYGQNPAVFDRLTSLLTLKIDDPSVFAEAEGYAVDQPLETASGETVDREAVLWRDSVRKIIADSLKEQMDRLKLEMKLTQDEEIRRQGMIQMIQLQKDLQAIKSNPLSLKEAE